MTLGPLAPLAAYRQFIVVLLVPRPNGKTDKLPLDPRTGVPSDAHNPAVWLDYDTARGLATAWGSTFTVGFVLTAADPFWCLDIDGCRTPSGWSARALEICSALPGAVIEVSQSGNGLHSLTRERIAQAAGCSAGLVSARLGTMEALRRSVMRAAVKRRVVRVVAEGLVAGDKHAAKADPELKALAAAWVTR